VVNQKEKDNLKIIELLIKSFLKNMKLYCKKMKTIRFVGIWFKTLLLKTFQELIKYVWSDKLKIKPVLWKSLIFTNKPNYLMSHFGHLNVQTKRHNCQWESKDISCKTKNIFLHWLALIGQNNGEILSIIFVLFWMWVIWFKRIFTIVSPKKFSNLSLCQTFSFYPWFYNN